VSGFLARKYYPEPLDGLEGCKVKIKVGVALQRTFGEQHLSQPSIVTPNFLSLIMLAKRTLCNNSIKQ